jgi:hypothetical protein
VGQWRGNHRIVAIGFAQAPLAEMPESGKILEQALSPQHLTSSAVA